MSYAEQSSTVSWSCGDVGGEGRSSSSGMLVEMSMLVSSARLVSDGDGTGVSDSSMDGDPGVDVSICPSSVGDTGSAGGSKELSGGS